MSRFWILSLLCLVVLPLEARQVVTGVVADKETHQPVQGVVVQLLQLPDSVQVETSQTNQEGLFMFYKTDTSMVYCLKFSHSFYKPITVPLAKKQGSMINSLGAINMEPNLFNLKEIVVNGFKMNVTEKADRTVYTIPEGFQKTSTDGIDVLRKVPSVQVDYLNEDITVNGKSNIKIEVDGISRDKSYLKRLHPSQISKMEVISNPSGKYDAEVDAVINIVTNPAMRYGLKGQFYAGGMAITSDSYLGLANGSLDYGLEKISYYVAANTINQHIALNTDMNRTAGTDVLDQNITQQLNAGLSNVNMGFIYDPDDKNDLSLNVAYNNTRYTMKSDAWNKALTSGISSLYKTTSQSDNVSGGLTTSLFYKHAFDKKTRHGLEAELNYYNSLGNKTNSDFINSYLNPADSSPLFESPWQHERSLTNVQNPYGQSNYTLPFDSLYFFNVGVNANFNRYRTDNTSSLTSVSNMDYTDLRVGGFAELSRNFSKGSLRIGSRFESSSVSVSASSPHYYYSILPYFNGLYKFDDKNSLKLAYSRRVIRPTSTQLNPFVSSVDSQTISHGNLDLKPAYRDNVQLTYNWRLPFNKFTINIIPELFYDYKTGLIQNVISQNATTNVFESIPVNISNGYEYGGALSVNSQIGKVLFNSDFRYSFYHVNKYLNQIDATNRQGWNWNSYAMFPLPLNFQFITLLYLNGPVLNGQTVSESSAVNLLGLIKRFKNNSVLQVMAYNPFARDFMHSKTTINSASFIQEQNTYLKKDYGILVVYVYTFKVGKSVDRQKRTIDQQVQDNMISLPINY